jgi:hypothetical protein
MKRLLMLGSALLMLGSALLFGVGLTCGLTGDDDQRAGHNRAEPVQRQPAMPVS